MTKLLIVEDNTAVRRVIKSDVANLAEEIHECTDGAAALAAYTTHQPGLVLMDIAITEMVPTNKLCSTRG